jgi:hypothetical protein
MRAKADLTITPVAGIGMHLHAVIPLGTRRTLVQVRPNGDDTIEEVVQGVLLVGWQERGRRRADGGVPIGSAATTKETLSRSISITRRIPSRDVLKCGRP